MAAYSSSASSVSSDKSIELFELSKVTWVCSACTVCVMFSEVAVTLAPAVELPEDVVVFELVWFISAAVFSTDY
jgi:hypothetical protein